MFALPGIVICGLKSKAEYIVPTNDRHTARILSFLSTLKPVAYCSHSLDSVDYEKITCCGDIIVL